MYSFGDTGRSLSSFFAAFLILVALVWNNAITREGNLLKRWPLVSTPASTICLSGHRSSVHEVFRAGAGSAVPCQFPRESQTRLYLCPGGLRSLVQVECTQPDNVWSDAAAISCSRCPLSHSTTLVVYIQDSVCSYSKVPWTYSLRDSCIAMPMILSVLSSQDAAKSDYKQQHQHPSEDFVWCRCLCSQRLAEQSLHAYQPREWTCRFAILLFRSCTASILTSTVSAAPTSKGDAAHEPP